MLVLVLAGLGHSFVPRVETPFPAFRKSRRVMSLRQQRGQPDDQDGSQEPDHQLRLRRGQSDVPAQKSTCTSTQLSRSWTYYRFEARQEDTVHRLKWGDSVWPTGYKQDSGWYLIFLSDQKTNSITAECPDLGVNSPAKT